MHTALNETVQGPLGMKKGDGLFNPSCYDHTGNICIAGGPLVNGLRLADVLPNWFESQGPTTNASRYQHVDECNVKMGTQHPCNSRCKC